MLNFNEKKNNIPFMPHNMQMWQMIFLVIFVVAHFLIWKEKCVVFYIKEFRNEDFIQ